ncbi:MAG: hypothetical protein WBA74_01680, partial [Cyclobacteriaceae bacterium]
MNERWRKHLGKGVIDCSVNYDETLIAAGGIDGEVFVLDMEGKILSKVNVGMPIWGIDINNSGDLISVALADKPNSKGKIVIIEKNRILFEKD